MPDAMSKSEERARIVVWKEERGESRKGCKEGGQKRGIQGG